MVNVSFYYKTLDASSYDQNARISSVSQSGLNLINQLSEFQNASEFSGFFPSAASSSAK